MKIGSINLLPILALLIYHHRYCVDITNFRGLG
jgi:hypothetical protein